MKYLFCFYYQSPEDYLNKTSFKSANGVWINAKTRNLAIERGIDYVNRYMADLYAEYGIKDFPTEAEYWIEDNPLKTWSGLALESMDEI